jgi:alginate O-acetyltransferase complex protein AlgI
MNFNSAAFALLLGLVLVFYYSLRDYRRQNLMLLVAGMIFYATWDYRFLFLLLYSASVDYIGGLGIVGERLRPRNALPFVGVMVTATILLLSPIDWASVGAVVLPHDAFSGGWSEPLRWRGLWLAGGSWLNVGAACAALVVLALTTIVGYRLPEASRPKYFVAVSMVANLALLGFFKYFDFFVSSAASLLGAMGLGEHNWVLGIVVPAGISFYTFQAMSYTIDVYRGHLAPTHYFPDYLLFVSFFPHLVAGPIQQANWLLPQLQRPRVFDWNVAQAGAFLIGWGLFKKIFIADNLAPLVSATYTEAANLTGPDVLFATYAFALQIYSDFSAYSDIARGTSRLLGIELTLNFNLPYIATNPQEFWRRWHISLSSWLRDYLYLPLGGSRGGTLLTYRNLLLTMILGGMWHGARMNFVLWGTYQGALLCGHRLLQPYLERITPSDARARRVLHVLSWVIFFHLTCYGWLLFRAESGHRILTMTAALPVGWGEVSMSMGILARVLWRVWPLLLMQLFQARTRNLLVALTWPWPVRTALYVCIFYLVVIFGAIDGVPFIYFQF